MARDTDRDESKSVRKSLLLTPTAGKLLAELAARHGVSVNELIERIARGEISIEESSGEALAST